MLDKPNETHAFVTELNEHGTGFAVRIDNGEQIFIRSVISEKSGIEVGDRIAVWYVPNRIEEHVERCPWFALHVRVAEQGEQVDVEEYIADKQIEDAFMNGSLEPEVEEEEPKRDIYGEAYSFLDMNGPATTAQIAEALNITTPNLRTYLRYMNDRREIARADIFARGRNQSKASVTVWACTLDELLPEEVEL